MTSSKPLVFIGVVTCNQENYIEACFNSIRLQTYSNLKVHISDDASTDSTVQKIHDYLKTYPEFNCSYNSNQVRVGISKNCNSLLDLSDGDYVQIFSGDDLMMPNKIALQVQSLENNPNAIFCFTNMEWFWSKTNRKIFNHFSWYRKPKHTLHDVISDFTIPTPTLLIRSTLLKNIRYNEDIEFVSDFYFVLQMMLKGNILYEPYISVRYRKHKKSSTLKFYFYEDRKKVVHLLNQHFPFEYQKSIKNYNYIVQYAKIMDLITNNKKAEALKLLPTIFPAIFTSTKWLARTAVIFVQLIKS